LKSIIKNILVGVILAAITIVIHTYLTEEKAHEFSSILLIIIGSIYFGFALVSNHKRAKIIEITVAVIFVIIGFVGLWISPWFIVVAMFLHGLWDILHHNKNLPLAKIPSWYIPFCASYDWIMAVYLTIIMLK
jgi:chromate transport protein ChrA